MLEILNAPTRYGDGVMGSATAYRGTFCYLAGFQNTAAEVGGLNGLAILRVPYTSVQAIEAKYLVDKLYFSDDLSDTSDAVDKIAQGATCRYFDQGEFISNKCGIYSFGIQSSTFALATRTSSVNSGSMYYGGVSATALGVSSKAYWLFVATGPGMGKVSVTGVAAKGMGWLIGTTAPSVTASRSRTIVGRVLGLMGQSSADFKVRFRIENYSPVAFRQFPG